MRGKVLFIDDQMDFLELLKVRLKNEEYEKFFLSDPSTASDLIEKEKIDVVISDMNMPKNGIELFKELRRDHPQVVRIALSGSLNTSTLLMAINVGDVYKYIPKPWKVNEEGKAVIKSAISYAHYLKSQNSKIITIEKLEEILDGIGVQYEIQDKNDDTSEGYDLNTKYSLKIKK
jgi:DNA-binding NtrC family response regulator